MCSLPPQTPAAVHGSGWFNCQISINFCPGIYCWCRCYFTNILLFLSTPGLRITSANLAPWFGWLAFCADGNNSAIPIGSCSFSTVLLFKVRDDGPFYTICWHCCNTLFLFLEVFMMMKWLGFHWYNWIVSQSQLLHLLYFPFGWEDHDLHVIQSHTAEKQRVFQQSQ